jgi:hypothetical protein
MAIRGRRHLPVPYVVLWSAERVTAARALTVRPDGCGLGYRGEEPRDRDRQGVLWARTRNAPGEGEPRFGAMHPARQRQAMVDKLCQVCGGPADRTSRGWLFLLPGTDGETQSEAGLSTKPPLCEPCARLALRHCPRLTNPVALRVRRPRVWGVFGDHYVPGPNGLAALPTDGYMPYGHPARRWFLASQLVLDLERCTRVPLPGDRVEMNRVERNNP